MPSVHTTGPDDYAECALEAALHWLPNAVGSATLFGRWKMFLLPYLPLDEPICQPVDDAIKHALQAGFPLDINGSDYLSLQHVLQHALAQIHRRIHTPGTDDGMVLHIHHGSHPMPTAKEFIARMKVQVFGDGEIPHPSTFQAAKSLPRSAPAPALWSRIFEWGKAHKGTLAIIGGGVLIVAVFFITGQFFTDPWEALQALGNKWLGKAPPP